MGLVVKGAVIVDQVEVNQLQQVSFQMDRPAVQIKEKRARIREKEAQIIDGKVIIQGIIQVEVFYIGKDNRVYYQQELFPFQTLCRLVGAGQGMDVWLELDVQDHLFSLGKEGGELEGKLFLTGQAVLTKNEFLSLTEGTDYHLLLSEVIARCQEEIFIQHRVFPVPELKNLGEIKTELVQLQCKVLNNRLLVFGELKEDVYYVEGKKLERHWQERFPFSCYIPAFGIEEELDAGEIVGKIKGVVTETVGEGKEDLLIKIGIELEAIVLRPVQAQVKKGAIPVWSLLILGENTRERLVAGTWHLAQRGKTVREVQAKVGQIRGQAVEGQVLLEGVLEKEVFYVGEDRLEYQQQNVVPVTDFISIPQAREGLLVRVSGRAGSGGWEIKEGHKLEEKTVLELYACVLKPAVVYL